MDICCSNANWVSAETDRLIPIRWRYGTRARRRTDLCKWLLRRPCGACGLTLHRANFDHKKAPKTGLFVQDKTVINYFAAFAM